jgi:antitoxin ParD1/3/4
MAKNTSVLIGDHFEAFIGEQVSSGRFASASEVVRAALRAFEEEEKRKDRILEALEEGERSGFVENFDFDEFLVEMHKEHLANK